MMATNTPPDKQGSSLDGAKPRSHGGRRYARAAGWTVMAIVAAVGVGEWVGWPFLGAPLQNWLSQRLERKVQLTENDDGAQGPRFRFVGGLRIDAPVIRIGPPSWQSALAPPTIHATDVHLALRYVDLWRAWRSGDLRVHALSAATFDAVLERRADGRATWQFGNPGQQGAAADDGTLAQLPTVDALQVDNGTVHWVDPGIDADVKAQLTLTQAETRSSKPSDVTPAGPQLTLTAQGRLRKLPLKLELRANGALPLLSDDTDAATLLSVDAHWGASALEFDGKAVDVLRASEASGQFLLKGPSLADLGDPFGVTLPTTAEFRVVGQVVRRGQTWNVVFNDATVGSSKLKGAFLYDVAAPIPVLSGRLTGARLHLSDLAPIVGASPHARKKGTTGKVLPDRQFDLPSLRVMQANVLIDVQEVDLDTDLLEPLRPLRAHLMLRDGVLRINQIDAQTAQGRLQGSMQLDGRQEQALWSTDLRWSGVQLADWIHQKRSGGSPPYVSGRLDGSAQWTGKGRSTAQILSSLNGPMRMFLRDGQISHLAIEVAGIDLFQGLGLLIEGDEQLPIRCGAADLVATKGVIRPKVLVVDTDDSAVLVDGSVSLADETLDLRVMVAPKDFSFATLRSPLRVRGKFADPNVSFDSASLGTKLAGSVLLGLINPLAALIPLIDPGNASAAADASAGCKALASRSASRPSSARGIKPSR